MRKVRRFDASVSFRDSKGVESEVSFPVYERDYSAAKSAAFTYALQILRLQDFELRMTGS